MSVTNLCMSSEFNIYVHVSQERSNVYLHRVGKFSRQYSIATAVTSAYATSVAGCVRDSYKSLGGVDDRRVTADGISEALLDVTDEERCCGASVIGCS